MIFVTVGTQEPFDRLIKAIDIIAKDLEETFIVQAPFDKYKPKNFNLISNVTPNEFEKYFEQAKLVIAHAGMGTIITAMTMQKPIILFPRIASLGEHRNDHQLDTAKKMRDKGIATVADNIEDIRLYIENPEKLVPMRIASSPSKELTDAIINFIG